MSGVVIVSSSIHQRWREVATGRLKIRSVIFPPTGLGLYVPLPIDAANTRAFICDSRQLGLDDLARLHHPGAAVLQSLDHPGGRVAGKRLQGAVVSAAVPRIVIVSPIDLPHPQVLEEGCIP